MPKINYLGIKLMSIKFYSLKDCKPEQSFTAVVHNGSTIYKSGILTPSKKHLDLSELSQIQFLPGTLDANSQISFKLTSFPLDSVTDNQISNYKQFSCKIPIMELVGKKNVRSIVCTYPLLNQAQIRADLQFKVNQKPKELSSEDIFNQIEINPVKNEQNKENLMTNKKVKAVISQARIIITPDMFVKNKRNSTQDVSYEYLNVGEQNFTPSPKSEKLSERPDNRNQVQLSEENCDLITKFEFLNKRFEKEDGEFAHQKSVWQQEQFQYSSKEKQRGLLGYNEFEIIHEESQSQRSSS